MIAQLKRIMLLQQQQMHNATIVHNVTTASLYFVKRVLKSYLIGYGEQSPAGAGTLTDGISNEYCMTA